MRISQYLPQLDEEIRRNPYNVEAYLQRGACYLRSEQYELALADLSGAILLDPAIFLRTLVAAVPTAASSNTKARSPTSMKRSRLNPGYVDAY